jgi:hypothetical protein
MFVIDAGGLLVERETATTLKIAVPADVHVPTLLIQLASDESWWPEDAMRLVVHQGEIRSVEICRVQREPDATPATLVVTPALCEVIREIQAQGFGTVTCRVQPDGLLVHHETMYQVKPDTAVNWQPGDRVEMVEGRDGSARKIRVIRAALPRA